MQCAGMAVAPRGRGGERARERAGRAKVAHEAGGTEGGNARVGI
jgi:hypothetical protein